MLCHYIDMKLLHTKPSWPVQMTQTHH
ncbi:hypothetical protein MAR_033638 [Mya arenaria]|uniref:Uncharacterized protein n=1 Tax=Mya arenaria TaxID=6604 RepID=A0ABY7GDQ2_MYAAR|nr:hypothetical protein MAR_033638 [Mya arenaria]